MRTAERAGNVARAAIFAQKLQKYRADIEAPSSLNSMRADACMRLVEEMCGTILADMHSMWSRVQRGMDSDEQLVLLELLLQKEKLRESLSFFTARPGGRRMSKSWRRS